MSDNVHQPNYWYTHTCFNISNYKTIDNIRYSIQNKNAQMKTDHVHT